MNQENNSKQEVEEMYKTYQKVYLIFFTLIVIVQAMTIYLSVINMFAKICIFAVSEITIIVAFIILMKEKHHSEELQDFVTYYGLYKIREKENDKQKR